MAGGGDGGSATKRAAKLGGETWKSFTEDEKKVYRDIAARLMEKRNKETDDAEEKQAADEAEDNDEVENKEDAPKW
ncbi:hypothetical protein HA466_0157690 [Hirschfeldia incana]|nr:hypothetical protein HA466_0157690 [Hirschfeldia incana]